MLSDRESDRELLELAAKAFCDAPVGFSPLTDDGDALRLAVKLRLAVRNSEVRASVMSDVGGASERHNGDDCAATRRAIVRAAAEIGKEQR